MLNGDLKAAAAGAVVCAAVVLTVSVTAVRAVFAVPLCLVLPGYAITAAAFARVQLRGLQTLMLVPALSLATLAIGSVLLDAAPGGLRIASWTILLGAVVLTGCAVAMRRRVVREGPAHFYQPSEKDGASAPSGAQPSHRHARRPRPIEVILLLIAGLTVSSALLLSRIALPASNAVGYTELWMLPSGPGQTPAVKIGVLSAEQHRTTYRLVLRTGSGAPLVVDSQLTLSPGSGTELNVRLTRVASRVPAMVTAQLYESGRAAVYRRVTAIISPPPRSRVSQHIRRPQSGRHGRTDRAGRSRT